MNLEGLAFWSFEVLEVSNILFVGCNFITCKMQRCHNQFDHIDEVKAFVDQLICLDVPVQDDVIISLLQSFLALYKYLITTLEMMPMKELMMNYMTVCLMHKMSNHK